MNYGVIWKGYLEVCGMSKGWVRCDLVLYGKIMEGNDAKEGVW